MTGQALVSVRAHKRIDAAKAGIAAFREDPEWLDAKAKSEGLAGGKPTEKDHGVVSQCLVQMQYSPL